jgi:hypothetical protein
METESCIGDNEFRGAAINRVAGKARSIAQIFTVRSTINAFAIGPTEPWNADAISDRE